MAMFSDAPYDTRPNVIYVFTHTIILKLKYFMVNKVLFYNMSVHDIATAQCIVNIREHREVIDRKYMFFY